MAKQEQLHTLSSGVRVKFIKIMPGTLDIIREQASKALISSGIAGKLSNIDMTGETDDAALALKIMDSLGEQGADFLMRQMAGDQKELLDFGVVMVDDLPESDRWITLLKRKGITLDDYLLDDPEDKKAAYLRYVAFGSDDDWDAFYEHTGLSAQGLAA